MNQKVGIITNKNENLLNALIYYMDQEQIEYVIIDDIKKIPLDVTHLIAIQNSKTMPQHISINSNIPVILVSDQQLEKSFIKNDVKNSIITTLVNDFTKYTDVQQEYLFRKGIYSIFLQKIGELLENIYNYNGMIYDLTEIKTIPDDWIFHFDSIAESYHWLSRMNQNLPNDFPRKVINFYSDKVYNDSLKEINYLTEKIMEIKSKKKITDLFIVTKEELLLLRDNYFFKLLVKNISNTYQIYLVDKEKLKKENKELLSHLLDGIIIYPNCIYKDTYQDELSLGYVDCNLDIIKQYEKEFTEVQNLYGYQLKKESDINEFLK